MSAVPCSARLRTEFGIFPAFINPEVEKCTVYMNHVSVRTRNFVLRVIVITSAWLPS